MARNVHGLLSVVVLAVGLAGCADLTTYNNVRSTEPPAGGVTVTYVDAKQRAVFTSKSKDATGYARTCAEPSPDALSAIAASQNLGTKDISEAFNLSEGAGSIGLRTASIQLMRDEMYRACEMYLSGAISESTWMSMHRRSQSLMVAVLAIEQLTGTVKAQQIALGGGASTGNADAILKLTTATETARSAMSDAQTASEKADQDDAKAQADVDTKQKALDKATTDDEKKTAQTALDLSKTNATKTSADAAAKKADFSNAKQAYESVNASRLAALNGQGSANSTGNFANPQGGADPQSAASMAVAVNAIVANTLQLSYGREICAGILENASSASDDAKLATLKANPVLEQCLALLKNGSPPVILVTNTLSPDGKVITSAAAVASKDGLFTVQGGLDPSALVNVPVDRPRPN